MLRVFRLLRANNSCSPYLRQCRWAGTFQCFIISGLLSSLKSRKVRILYLKLLHIVIRVKKLACVHVVPRPFAGKLKSKLSHTCYLYEPDFCWIRRWGQKPLLFIHTRSMPTSKLLSVLYQEHHWIDIWDGGLDTTGRDKDERMISIA